MAEPTMEQQVARLTAIEDIKQMKALYCAYCDDGYDPEGIGALFVEEGIWDGADFGRYVGRAAIMEFFGGISGDITFAGHLVLNPIITVDGDTANGKWWLIMPCTTNIEGKKEESEVNGTFVHKGLAQRSFERVWTITDDTEVGSVKFEDGLLTVELGKVVPEHHKRKDYI